MENQLAVIGMKCTQHTSVHVASQMVQEGDEHVSAIDDSGG